MVATTGRVPGIEAGRQAAKSRPIARPKRSAAPSISKRACSGSAEGESVPSSPITANPEALATTTIAHTANTNPSATRPTRATVNAVWRALDALFHSDSTPAMMTSERSCGGAIPSADSTKLKERDSAAALSRNARHWAQLSTWVSTTSAGNCGGSPSSCAEIAAWTCSCVNTAQHPIQARATRTEDHDH